MFNPVFEFHMNNQSAVKCTQTDTFCWACVCSQTLCMQHACGLFPSPTSCSHTFIPSADPIWRPCMSNLQCFTPTPLLRRRVFHWFTLQIQRTAPATPGFLRSGSVESAPAISHSTNFFLGSEVCLLCRPLCLVTSHSSKHSPPAREPRLLWGKQAHYVANVTICAISGGGAAGTMRWVSVSFGWNT